MTNPYNAFREEDKLLSKENIIDKAPSQNIDKENEVKQVYENPYAKFREVDRQNERNQVKANLQLVMDKDPDQVGEALRLTQELGLPEEFALNSDKAVSLMIEKQKR